MIKIRSELGRDAVILNTRKIKKPGIKVISLNHFVEVVAAIDEPRKEKEPEKIKKQRTREKNASIGACT